jgi:hypothetical protein
MRRIANDGLIQISDLNVDTTVHRGNRTKIADVTISADPDGRSFGQRATLLLLQPVKSHPTPTPGIAAKGDPINRAETGVAEPQIAKQSRSWRAAIGEGEIMRGS